MRWNITFTRAVIPSFSKTRRLDPEKLEIAIAEFKSLESAGIVRRSQTACDLFVSRFCPHFAATAVPFGFHFRIQCADVESARSEKRRCQFSVPSTPLPPVPSGTVAAVAEADPVDSKPWPLSKTAVQKRSICSAVYPSNWLSDKQALSAWLAMFPREFFIPLSQQYSEKTFSGIFTAFPTLGGWPLGALCLLGLSGAASPTRSPAGQNPACTASGARSTATPACYRSPSPSPAAVCSSPH